MNNKNIFRRIISIRGMGQVITVSFGLVVLIIAFGFMNPTFLSGKNIGNLLRQIAPILLIGIGQSYLLITGNIDLSIGSVVGMSCMISATLMTKGVNPWIAVAVTFCCCVSCYRHTGGQLRPSSIYRYPGYHDHCQRNCSDC